MMFLKSGLLYVSFKMRNGRPCKYSQLELSNIEFSKLTPKFLMENCDHPFVLVGHFYFYMIQLIRLDFWKLCLRAICTWYSFKITCILLSQVISLKKMVVLPAEFTVLISWSPVSIPLILISEIDKYLSCNNA